MITLTYLLIASLYMVLFFGCYWLLLRRNTFFGLNRAYLLASIVISLGLPFIELPDNTVASLPLRPVTLPTFVVGSVSAVESVGWSATQWIWLVYGIGVTLLLLRLGLTSWAVFRLIRRGTLNTQVDYTLVQLPDDLPDRIPSFSFGPYLVLNATDARMQPAALLRHEEAHIRQFHTVDILFLEVVKAFFWFNPVLWFYKIALQEVHEFLADRAAIRQLYTAESMKRQTEIQPTYAQQLVAYALDVPINALTTPFASVSTLKQRIYMLQKPSTHRRALLRYALVLPLAACLVMCTQTEQDQPINSAMRASAQPSAKKAIKVDGEVFTVVEQQPEFPGGMEQLTKYLGENLRYPETAQKANAEGRVFVNFIVTKTGEITDVKILKGIGFGADEEAARVVSQMPKWIPARQNGQLVNVRFNLPINFQMDDENSKQVSNDFWRDLAKYKTFTLDGKKINKNAMRAVADQALKDDVHISFFIHNKISTVAFTHVDQKEEGKTDLVD